MEHHCHCCVAADSCAATAGRSQLDPEDDLLASDALAAPGTAHGPLLQMTLHACIARLGNVTATNET